MKSVLNVITRGCVFAVALALIICLIGLGLDGEPSVGISQLLLIILIGEVISLAQEIFRIHSLRPLWRLLIHYAALLCSFLILSLVTDKITTGGATGIFIFIILFTLIYALIFAAIALVKKRLSLPVLTPQKACKKASAVPSYTPRYK